MSESKLLKSVIIGALVGAAISMFDRKTREHTIENLKKAKDAVQYYANNHEELQHLIGEKLEEIQSIYESASENINVIVNKIDEVKEIPSAVQDIVVDTKVAFTPPTEPLN